MAEQLWKGRFSKAVDSRVNDFNSSIRFDQRMIAQDMRGSGVHAAAPHILGDHPLIKADGGVEIVDARVHRLGKAAFPQLFCHKIKTLSK